MYHLLGLGIEQTASGPLYHLMPQVAGVDVNRAEGGFETALGVIRAKWRWDASHKMWSAEVGSPPDGSARWCIGIPKAYGRLSHVTVDDRETPFEAGARHYTQGNISGGLHTLHAHFA